MALLTPQQVGITGTTVTFQTVAATDTAIPDDRAFLEFQNTNAALNNVTIVVPGSDYGQPRADIGPIAVPANTGRVRFGPLVADLADPATGLISVTSSNTGAGSTVALVRI